MSTQDWIVVLAATIGALIVCSLFALSLIADEL